MLLCTNIDYIILILADYCHSTILFNLVFGMQLIQNVSIYYFYL